MSSQKISELAKALLDKALEEEANEDIYAAGLKEQQTFEAFVDIVNYYVDFYRTPSWFFQRVIQEMHRRKDEETLNNVMKMLMGEKL